MNELADENLASIFTHLPVTSLIQASQTCTGFLPVSRSDRLWLPLIAQRWRFGTLPTTGDVLLPGTRDMVSASAMADAASAPVCNGSAAFGFFHKRSHQESNIVVLALQHCSSLMGRSDRNSSKDTPSASDFHAGMVVEVHGLNSAAHYNGCTGVIGHGKSLNDRLPVVLSRPLTSISVKAQNLTAVSAALTSEDALRQVLSVGADAVDVLLCMSASAISEVAHTGQRLLGAVMEQWAIQQWKQLKERKEQLDLLEEGAFIVAQWAEPDQVDVAAVRASLASLVDTVAQHSSPLAPLRERIEAVNAVLFEQHGFKGNTQAYYDPQNSLLHKVLSRKVGIPISLSIVWAAVARRLKIPCHLCARMPGHIIIRVTSGHGIAQDLYVDAFNHEVMDHAGLLRFTIGRIGRPLQDDWVSDGSPTLVYERLLRNLLNIYQEECQRALQSHSLNRGTWISCQRTVAAFSQIAAITEDEQGARNCETNINRLQQFMDEIDATVLRS